MENTQQPSTGKYALNYGILLGAISVVFGLMLYFMDMHYQQNFGTLAVSLVIMLAVIIIALKQFKKANGEYMTFGQGLKIGIGLCLIGGIISILYQLLLSNVIDPDMAEKQLEIARIEMAEYGMTQEEIEGRIEMSKKFSGPWIQAGFGLIGSIFFGFILSLIPTLVLKKTDQQL